MGFLKISGIAQEQAKSIRKPLETALSLANPAQKMATASSGNDEEGPVDWHQVRKLLEMGQQGNCGLSPFGLFECRVTSMTPAQLQVSLVGVGSCGS